MESQAVVVDRRRLKKSHNGCAKCKARRIKCDEGKPSCLQCTSRQKTCPGYSQTLKWPAKHQRRIHTAPSEQNQGENTGKKGRRSKSQATEGNAKKPDATAAESSKSPSSLPQDTGCAPSNPTGEPLRDSLGQQNWFSQNTVDFAPQDMSIIQSVQDGSQLPTVHILFNYEGLGWDRLDDPQTEIVPTTTIDSENTVNTSLPTTETDRSHSRESFHVTQIIADASPTKHSQATNIIPPGGNGKKPTGIAAEFSNSPLPLVEDTAYALHNPSDWLLSLFDCDILASDTVISNTANLDLTIPEVDRSQQRENFHTTCNTANASSIKLIDVPPNITISGDVSLDREIPGEIESAADRDRFTLGNRPRATQSGPERLRGSDSVRLPSDNLMVIDDGDIADDFDQSSPSIEMNCEVPWQTRSAQVRTQPLHIPTFLMEYWFSRVCPIFSTFDCGSNPLRVQLDMLWQRSAPVYHSMLSMAAACLHDQMPQMRMVALQSKSEAVAQLQSGLRLLESSSDTDLHEDLLMTCCLLGFSTAWHDAQDLGFKYLDAAKALLKRTRANDRSLSTEKQQTRAFFVDGLVYWRMIAGAVGYVDNSRKERSPSTTAFREASCSPTQGSSLHLSNECLQFPHPWTGSATTTQDIISQVFTLGQRQRTRLKKGDFSKRKDLEQALLDIQTAQGLEEALLELDGHPLGDIYDTGDSRTPKSHFIHLLEAYRVTGLLLTYRSFPDLSLKRLGLADGEGSQVQVESFLRSLAIFVIDQLRKIHPTSGTRCIQPILLISVSSELQFHSIPSGAAAEAPTDGYISHDDVATAKARGFILDRLHCYERSLPSKPITTAKSLVREVWNRLDKGQHCHWTEVVMDTKLQSFFG